MPSFPDGGTLIEKDAAQLQLMDEQFRVYRPYIFILNPRLLLGQMLVKSLVLTLPSSALLTDRIQTSEQVPSMAIRFSEIFCI